MTYRVRWTPPMTTFASNNSTISTLIALLLLGLVWENCVIAAPHDFLDTEPSVSPWSEDGKLELVASLSLPEALSTSRSGRNRDSCGFRLDSFFHWVDVFKTDGRVYSSVFRPNFQFQSVSRLTLLCLWQI
jgi:hypothetical protein